ncbi:MAG: hypothetical protein AB7P33_08630 [Dehalococcoidia bacterium]
MATKREMITSRGASRYIRRDEKGRFTTDQVDKGASLAADRRQQAKTTVPKGQGDKGDQKRS